MVIVTGTNKSLPLTDSPADLKHIKEIRKRLRKGLAVDTEQLYGRLLATPTWYYSENKGLEWKHILGYLTTGLSDTGSVPLYAAILTSLTKQLLSDNKTVERGLALLVSLAKISGHFQHNLVRMYTELSKRFGFRLVVAPSAAEIAGKTTVPNNTFSVAVGDREIRVRLTSTQDGGSESDYHNIVAKYSPGSTDQEYTYDFVSTMTRAEFDRRRHLHNLYGVYTHDIQQHPDYQWGEYAVQMRLDHLQGEHPNYTAVDMVDPHMGDAVFGIADPDGDLSAHHLIEELATTHPDTDPETWDQEYTEFHTRQYDVLTRLGLRRQAEIRPTAVQHALIDGAATALGQPTYPRTAARRRLCDDDDGQTGSGMPHTHHVGASVDQQIIAGTGQLQALPGYHRMPTGEIMPNNKQTGSGVLPPFTKMFPNRPGDNPAPYLYMGAGNPMDGRVPYVAPDGGIGDEISMDHDYEYGSAVSFSDVDRADKKFVERMRVQPGAWPAFASTAIAAKNKLESGLGHSLYPTAADLESNQQLATMPYPTAENLRNADAIRVAKAEIPAQKKTRAPVQFAGPLFATIAWGQGLPKLRHLGQVLGPTGDMTTRQIVAQIRAGEGFHGGTRREISAAIAARATGRGKEQHYLVGAASLDEQWAYLALLAVSRSLAVLFLKVCYTRHARGLSYGSALQAVAHVKPQRPVNNAIDLLAHFLSQA